MERPRWRDDVLLVAALLAVLGVGIWALWWEDVRRLLSGDESSGSAAENPQVVTPRI